MILYLCWYTDSSVGVVRLSCLPSCPVFTVSHLKHHITQCNVLVCIGDVVMCIGDVVVCIGDVVVCIGSVAQ